MKYHINKTSESPLYRLCGEKGESVQHITSGCEKVAQKLKKNTKDTTMLQRKFIGIFVKRTGYNTVKSGVSVLRKQQ